MLCAGLCARSCVHAGDVLDFVLRFMRGFMRKSMRARRQKCRAWIADLPHSEGQFQMFYFSARPYLLISDSTGALCHLSVRGSIGVDLGHSAAACPYTGRPVPLPPAPVDAWVSCTGEALAPNATDVLCTC